MLGDEVEVAEVLGRQGRQIELGRGEIDAFARLQPHPLLARRVNLDLRPAGGLGDHPRRRLAVVDEHFRADRELVDELGKIKRERDRLPGLFAQFVDQHDPVAARKAGLRRRLHPEDAALRAGDVHQHPAGTLEPRRRLAHVFDHLPPDLGVVVGAVDARAVHAGGHQIVDKLGFRSRFRRQGRHHPGVRTAPPRPPEQPVRLRLQFRRARYRRRRRGVGGGRLAGQAPQGRDERFEGQRDLALAAAERRQAAGSEPVLEIGEVVLAQREIEGKIENSGGLLVGADPP